MMTIDGGKINHLPISKVVTLSCHDMHSPLLVYERCVWIADLMAIEGGEGFGVVGDHSVEVKGLRVAKVSIWDRNGSRGPIRAEPAPETVGIVASAKVVVAGFRVSLFSFEFVILRATISVGMLTPEGVKVGVVADDASVGREDA